MGSSQYSRGTKVRVDKTIASTRPPNSAHPSPPLPKVSASNPFPNSPKPPPAIRVMNNNAPYSPHTPNRIGSNNGGGTNGKKTTFSQDDEPNGPILLTRTYSNSSSRTYATGSGAIIRLGVCAMDKKARSKPPRRSSSSSSATTSSSTIPSRAGLSMTSSSRSTRMSTGSRRPSGTSR